MANDNKRVIVVGGGLAGLAATVRVAEAGMQVDLFSLVPVKRSHSVCAQGGINACTEPVRQEGFTEWNHFDETLYGGDFLNHQPPVYEMTHWAPKIIDIMDRMGVPFNRTQEGFLDRRYFGGSLFRRTHFSGASTGQQLLYALDEQTRRYQAAGLVNNFEFWEMLWPVIDDDGVCRGIVAQDVRTMETRAFKADAVVMATGGPGVIFGKSTMSVICNGGAASRCYQAGAWLGNPEMIQVHPTAIPGEDKCRLMSESARGEGGRVWVPAVKGPDGKWQPHPDAGRDPKQIPDNERWYILEEKYPEYKNLVSRDVATREIFFTCRDGFGVGGGRMAYLDITHLPAATKNKLHAILEIYEKFTGDDPREIPMKIFPAVHYSMGGLWTTYTSEERVGIPGDAQQMITGLKPGAPNNMMTNIPGLYAFGEVNYQYHGATRLGANALLNCIFDGIFNGPSVVNYVRELDQAAADMSDAMFDAVVTQENDKAKRLIENTGGENPYLIHKEMGEWMTDFCTVIRDEEGMTKLYAQLQTWKERYKNVSLSDTGVWSNQNLSFTRALGDMITYADAIVLASIERKESRGSHYRPDYPTRDDPNWHKTTIAKYDGANDKPILEYEPIDACMVELRARDYGKKAKKAEPAAAK